MTTDPSLEQPSCANALSQFRTNMQNIKWIKTTINTLDSVDKVYIAVNPTFGTPCRKNLRMSGDYYIELHTHTAAHKLSDKMRIKHFGGVGAITNILTSDPKDIDAIGEEDCNIVQVKDKGIEHIPFIKRPQLITNVMNSMSSSSSANIFFNDIAAFNRWCIYAVRQKKDQHRQEQQEAIQVSKSGGFTDSFAVKESDYGNFLHNDLNSGYDQYSDYVESSILSSGSGLYNVNYDSLLVLSLCGVIGLVLLFCLICFVFALVCGYIAGKMHRIRKIATSEIASY
eukprot:984075_1